MSSGPITSWQIDGETVETVSDFMFFWAPKSLQMVTAAMKLKDAYSFAYSLANSLAVYDQPRQRIKNQRHYFADKGLSSQGYGFSSSHCVEVRVGLLRKLNAKELMLLNRGVGEDS